MARFEKCGRRWTFWAMAVSGAGLVYGCSQLRFEGCRETRSCIAEEEEDSGVGGGGRHSTGSGGGGLGGEGEFWEQAGSGGLEGAPLPEVCSKDSDCDDGKACTGKEVCKRGKCERGAAPCENPDPAHCAATCSEGDSGAICQVTALDLDGDGFGTNECLSAPGGDCNDSPGDGASVFPGAPEICNENVDDDCDGLDDTSDDIALPGIGLELVSSQGLGTTRRGQPALSRAFNLGSGFGLAWTDFRHQDAVTTSEIYFRSVAQDGTLGVEQRLTQETAVKDKRHPSIRANDAKSFRVLWLYTGVDKSPLGSGTETPGLASRATDSTAPINLLVPGLVGAPKLASAAGSNGTLFFAKDHATASLDGLHRREFDAGGFITVPDSTSLRIPVPAGDYQSFDVSSAERNTFIVASVLDLEGVGKVSAVWANGNKITIPAGEVSQTDVVAGANLVAFRERELESGESRIVLASVTGTLCSVNLPDGVPVALSDAALVYFNPQKTALYARVITKATECLVGRSALVVQQSEERVISEPDVANDGDMILVSFTEHDTTSDRWSIGGRLFSRTLCE